MTDVEVALEVLESAYRPAKREPQQTAAVRLALRVLRQHAPRQWLVDYWDACGNPDGEFRQQNMSRCLNGIKLRLRD